MLALVGSGEYLPGVDPIDRYLLSQLNDPPRVVCLPTAAGTEGPQRVEYWMDLGVQHFTRLGAQVESLELLNRTHAHEPRLEEPLRAANFIYLSGGKPDYLYRTLEGTKSWQAILDTHLTGGVVAGCSAGAMIFGEAVLGMRGLSEGFGLLPNVVVLPHFDEFGGMMLRMSKMLAGRHHTLVGIDGNTALVVDDAGWRVVGSGGVTVFQHGGEQRYSGGEEVALPG